MKFNKLLEQTQFHGGRRLAEKKCRRLWSVPMLLLFVSSVLVVQFTIMRFLDNPTYIVQMEILPDNMEFPSVFLCPEVYYRKDKVDRFLNHVKIPPKLNYTYLREVMFMLAAFVSPDVPYKLQDLLNLEYLLQYNDMDVDTAGELLTSACRSTFLRCRWESEFVNCSHLFHMELTNDGFCCVFNGRSLKKDAHDTRSKFEWYVENFGLGSGLVMVVNQSVNLYYNLDLSYKWLALQTGQHFVESTVNGTPLSPNTEVWVDYHLKNFQIGDFARTLSHSLRKCHMAYTPLKYFPIYHKRYCVLECEAELTLKRCNCVRRVHPLPPGARYCSARKLLCAKQSMVSYDSVACKCLPACDVASDDVKIDRFELDQNVHAVDPLYDNLKFSNVTIIRVFVHNKEIETNMRWSYYNYIDLFAQLGGVFNMFFGCSILTLVELGILAWQYLKPKLNKNTFKKIKFLQGTNKKIKKTKRQLQYLH